MTTPPLIAALTGQRGPTPVWFMRQAGRSLPEYRELRADIGLPMLEACLRPDVAAEATVQPVRRHGVDAGIFFSDIMVPLRLAGVGVEIEPGVGPVLDHPYRTRESIDELLSHRYGEGSWTDSTGRTRDCTELVMYFDCVNSSPSGTEFAAGQSLEYCGETYEVVSAELFAGEDPHHWRVKARKTGGEHI